MKAVGYPRVSTVNQGQIGYSLDKQITAIEQFATDNNIELLAHFPEVKSANTLNKRKTFQALIRRCTKPGDLSQIDIVLVTNLDRYGREAFLSEAVRRTLRRNGVRIVSVEETYLTPVREPENEHPLIKLEREIQVRKRDLDAEAERLKIVYRCQKGREEKVKQGGWIGFRPPYEYDVVQGELVLNKERARVLRLIYRLQKLDYNPANIRDYLNGQNNLLNPDGTRGRKFPPPSKRLRLRKRQVPYIYKNEDWQWWTVNRIIQRIGYKRTEQFPEFPGETFTAQG